MFKYCSYCGNRLKKATLNSIVNNLNSTPIYALEVKDSNKLIILPEEHLWVLFSGDGDTGGGDVRRGNLNLALNDVLSTTRYQRYNNNSRLTPNYYAIFNSDHTKLNDPTIDINDKEAVLARYVAYLTQNKVSLFSFKSYNYANEQDLIAYIENDNDSDTDVENGKKRKPSAPKKKFSAEEGWKRMLEGVSLKTLKSKGILFLMGDSPGMTADIKNTLKNEYNGLEILSRFKKESPPQADHSEGERDYYDIVMYHPSIKSKLREDVKIYNKSIVSFEDKYSVSEIKLDDKVYKLGLIHRVG